MSCVCAVNIIATTLFHLIAGDLFTAVLILIGHESIQVTNGAEGRRRHAAYSKCYTPSVVKLHFKTFNEVTFFTIQ
jgi:hypothetical protein